MSRIGKLPISIPQQVKVSIDDQLVTIEGPKGKLSRRFDKAVRFNLDAAELRVEPATDSRHSRAMYGTSRSILQNMVDGVVNGYSKSLEIHGVGFRATLKGDILDLALG